MKWSDLERFELSEIEGEKKRGTICWISIFGFQCVVRKIEGWLTICTSYFIYTKCVGWFLTFIKNLQSSSTYNWSCLFSYLSACLFMRPISCRIGLPRWNQMLNSVEVHPQLSINRQPMYGALVGVGSLWPYHSTFPFTHQVKQNSVCLSQLGYQYQGNYWMPIRVSKFVW
jgi:hypothetical protein